MTTYRILLIIGIIVLALGILFATIMRESMGSLGYIFVAVGGVTIALALYQKGKASGAS